MKKEAFYNHSSAKNASFPSVSSPFFESGIHNIKVQSFYPVIYFKAKHIVIAG